jgi:glutathione S-transferase
VLKQWDNMEARLRKPDQQYVALPDRPTIADLSYFLFAMLWMFNFLGVDIEQWPNIKDWGERMLELPKIQTVLSKSPTYGH